MSKKKSDNPYGFVNPTNETGSTGLPKKAFKLNASGSSSSGGSGGSGSSKTTVTYSVPYVDVTGSVQSGIADSTWDDTYYKTMKEYYQQMYAQALEYNNALAQQEAEYAQSQAKAQQQSVNDEYSNLNKQLYRDYMNSLKALPQFLAAMGITGGGSESARVALDTGYGENLSTNERNRISENTKLDTTANEQAYAAKVQAQKANQSALETQYSNIAKLMSQQYSDKNEYLQQLAKLLASGGDYSGYANLGLSDSGVNYLTNLWLQSNPELYSTWAKYHS